MKIRILENSIRLRLTQTEVKQLLVDGSVRQTIIFGANSNQQLNYSIQKKAVAKIEATYDGKDISVNVPNEIADNWAKSDHISLEELMPIGERESLKILIEKDFKCLTVRAGEDESDMFPNPDQEALKC